MRAARDASALAIVLGLGWLAASGCASQRAGGPDRIGERVSHREDPFVTRHFQVHDGDRWIGSGVAYGPFRDGQYPGGPGPTREEIIQDLRLLTGNWGLLRLYGAGGPSETILEVIQAESLDLKVMLGIWIGAEERQGHDGDLDEPLPGAVEANRREIEAGVRLAGAYPGIVVALCVGNETQVRWSPHRMDPDRLIDYLREVRARVAVPVSTADDFSYWKTPESTSIARETDFVTTHIHPLWNGIRLADAMTWTSRTFEDVQALHPGRTLVIGETGWATRMHDEGEQARLIKGQPGEDEQRVFHEALTAWVNAKEVPTFFFEAFDENWKGGEHPDHVEKHWGLFRADRTPKKALMGGGPR